MKRNIILTNLLVLLLMLGVLWAIYSRMQRYVITIDAIDTIIATLNKVNYEEGIMIYEKEKARLNGLVSQSIAIGVIIMFMMIAQFFRCIKSFIRTRNKQLW